MDMNISDTLISSQGIREGIIAGFVYDVISVAFAFFIVKILYDKYYMKYKWGEWHIQINETKNDATETLLERELSSQVAKRILEDRGEFSIYAKGVVSPFVWLNIDIASKEAENIGMVIRDKTIKKIIIDISKNPKKEKKKPIQFSETTQKQIDTLEKDMQSIMLTLENLDRDGKE